MSHYFFDSSAIVKRYYREPGTDWVRAVCGSRGRPTLYLSSIAHVEVVRALRQKQREGLAHQSFIDAQINQFERHLAMAPRSYHMIPLETSIVTSASTLCNQFWDVRPHPLRSLDALQLASALAAAATTTEEIVFVTSDRRLAAVALLVGMNVVDPAHP